MCLSVFCLADVEEPGFLGAGVQRAESSCVRTTDEGPDPLFTTRGGDPSSDLRMSMTKLTSPTRRPEDSGEASSHSFWLRWGPWTMILLPVFVRNDTCHRSTGVCESFLFFLLFFFLLLLRGASFCVRTILKRLPSLTTTQVHTVTKDGTRSSIHIVGGGERSRHSNTREKLRKKSNGTLLIQLQHSPYSFFLNPLLSGCKLFWGIFFLFPF